MAIVSNKISARVRLADEENKTMATYNDVDTAVTANEIDAFSTAVSALRMSPAISKYLVVETEISDDGSEA